MNTDDTTPTIGINHLTVDPTPSPDAEDIETDTDDREKTRNRLGYLVG